MKTGKRILSVFLIVLMLLASAPLGLFIPSRTAITASAVKEKNSGYYTYTVKDGKATITDCADSIKGKVTIPSKLGGYPVVAIAGLSFAWCRNITEIILPSSITNVEGYAFGIYCGINLKKAYIPTSVTKIGEHAFGYKDGGIMFLDENGRNLLTGAKINEKNKSFVIYAKTGSAAHAYAQNNGLNFSSTGATKPLAPENLKTKQTSDSITLLWDKVVGASGYYVYEYTDKNKYEKTATVKTNSYKATNLKKGSSHKYKVYAYLKSAGKTYVGKASGIRTLTVNKISIASSNKADKISLKWSVVPGASSYNIYLCTVKAGKKIYTKVATSKTNKVTLTGLKGGKDYKYAVIGYSKSRGKYFWNTIYTTTAPKKVSGLTVGRTNTSITLNWNPVNGTTSYQVFMLDTKSGKYNRVKTVSKYIKDNAWFDSQKGYAVIDNLKPGTKYTFKVRAYKELKNKKYYGVISEPIEITTNKSSKKYSPKETNSGLKLFPMSDKEEKQFRTNYKKWENFDYYGGLCKAVVNGKMIVYGFNTKYAAEPNRNLSDISGGVDVAWQGTDLNGYFYNDYGIRAGYCGICGKVLGLNPKKMCSGTHLY